MKRMHASYRSGFGGDSGRLGGPPQKQYLM